MKLDKFVAIVGNPPYQVEDGGDATSSSAVYHYFMNQCQQVGQYISLVYPARWMNGGRGGGLPEFRKQELYSHHYDQFHDFLNARLFPTVDIPGGVNYFLWSESPSPTCGMFFNGVKIGERSTIGVGLTEHVRNPEYARVALMVHPERAFSEIVGARDSYGKNFRNISYMSKLPEVEEGLKAYWTDPRVGVQSRLVPVGSTVQPTDDWKVFVSRTTNNDHHVFNRPTRIFIGEPGSLCSDSFLKVGSFSTEQEAIKCLQFMKTDFVMFLVGIITHSQHMTKSSYNLVPLVDCDSGEVLDRPGSFLDFAVPESLDDQLAVIYGLSDEDRTLISSDLKPWKNKVSASADM